MWPDQQSALVGIGVAALAPSIAVALGVPVRWLAAVGLGGALVLWGTLTLTAPSDDREITKAEYTVLWAGVAVVWLAVWMVATLLAAAVRTSWEKREFTSV